MCFLLEVVIKYCPDGMSALTLITSYSFSSYMNRTLA